MIAAETHESSPVDQIKAQQRMRPGVEEKPRDAGVLRVVAPFRSRSF